MKAAPQYALALLLVTGSFTLQAQSGDLSGNRSGPRSDAQSVATANATASEQEAISGPGSGVRIVRLSQIRGEVQLDHNVDRGFESAFPNQPIVERSRLKTMDGVAEIEFEDNSSLRLTPNTIVEFAQLRRTPAGTTVSTVRVTQGLIYVSLANTKGDAFRVAFGDRQLALGASAHVELFVEPFMSRVGVLAGTVQLLDAAGTPTTTVSKNHSLVFDPAAGASPELVAKVEKTEFADWDKTAVQYHQQSANLPGSGGTAASYGSSDLNYYGSFAKLPGCGSVWRPYFASAGWDPYANGAYAWYGSGVGYSWVSPYPWGWTPFHSGSWQQCGSAGWGWSPVGAWAGLNNTGLNRRLPRLPGRPDPGRPTLLLVNARPLVISRLTGSESFAFHQDSAGLGVPRAVFGKLSGISTSVALHGGVVAPVSAPAGTAPRSGGQTSGFALNAPAFKAGSTSVAPSGAQRSGGWGSRSGMAIPSGSGSAVGSSSGGHAAGAGSGGHH